MPNHTVEVSCPVPASFRVDQVRGMFDLKPAKTAGERFDVELPDDSDQWQIGVIVGPSGSGKSTVARHAYGDRFCEALQWPTGGAVVEGFDEALSIKEITATLTAVGFSSPPSWVKPYHVLSGGERFRCDLARALLSPGNLIAFDEFTSVVDRNVAKIGSAAIAKSIRKGRIKKRFVAVTCHYDVLDWLEPDWVLDMATQQLARGSLHRRPTIELEIAPVHRSAWLLFRRHHYLDTNLSNTARAFVAFWGAEPVAFSAWMHQMTSSRESGDMREHRTVVLPDYQGIGIGNRVSEFCASIYRGLGRRAFSTTSHPSMLRYRSASPLWDRRRLGRAATLGTGSIFARKAAKLGKKQNTSRGRITGGFEYVGPPMPRDQAEAMLAARPRVFALPKLDADVLLAIARGASTPAAIARRLAAPAERVRAALERLVLDARAESFRVGKKRVYRAADPAGPSNLPALPHVRSRGALGNF